MIWSVFSWSTLSQCVWEAYLMSTFCQSPNTIMLWNCCNRIVSRTPSKHFGFWSAHLAQFIHHDVVYLPICTLTSCLSDSTFVLCVPFRLVTVFASSGVPVTNGLTLITAWICNHTHYQMWDEITSPFPNFNGSTKTHKMYMMEDVTLYISKFEIWFESSNWQI